MPTYDYICKECKHTLEMRESITAEPLKTCPVCHRIALQRCVSGGSALFRFKGSGFHLTDYCKKESSDPSTSCPCKGPHTCK